MSPPALSKQAYPHADLPAGEVLLYRRTSKDPYSCQVAGCPHAPFRSYRGAMKHGRLHRAELGLPEDEGVHVHTGARPLTKDAARMWARQKEAQSKRARRAAKREATRGPAPGPPMAPAAARVDPDSGVERLAPCGVTVDPADPAQPGTAFRVLTVADVPHHIGGSKQKLRIFGEPEGEAFVNACESALGWLRLHQSALKAQFGGAVADWSNPGIRWWMEMVEVATSGYKKTGGSVGLAAACSLLQAYTGMGVEKSVMMTGYVSLSGRVLRVSGLEGKLAAAHAARHVEVFVLPKVNQAEAEQIIADKGFTSIWALGVESMAEVVYHLFKYSVHRHGLRPPPALGLPDEGRLVCARTLYVLDETSDRFSLASVECALLPGTGELSVTGCTHLSNVEDAEKALRLVVQCCRGFHPDLPVLRDLTRWDVRVEFVSDEGGDGIMTVAVTAALLALVTGRALDHGLVFGSGMSILGDVEGTWVGRNMKGHDIGMLSEEGCRRLLVHRGASARIRSLIASMGPVEDGGAPSAIDVVDLPLQLRTPADMASLSRLLWG